MIARAMNGSRSKPPRSTDTPCLEMHLMFLSAKTSLAACIKVGIVNDKQGNMKEVKGNITRAETAVIVRGLLIKSNLIWQWFMQNQTIY